MDNFLVTDPTYLATLALAVIAIITASATASRWLMKTLATTALWRVISIPNAELEAATVSWWRRRLIGIAIGMASGAAALTWSVWWLGINRSQSAADWVVLGGIAGGIVGAGVHQAFVSDSGHRTTSVAHSRMLRLGDFTPAWLRYLARVAVSVSVVLAITVTVAPFFNPRYSSTEPSAIALIFLPPPFLLTALGLLALVRFELSGRRIVQRPTSARSEDDLAIDAILRCLAVRDMAQAAALVGGLGSLLLLPEFVLSWNLGLLGRETLAILEGFQSAVVVLACVGVTVAIFGPARIRPPIGLPNHAPVKIDVPS